jgi:hypothetical protein
MSEPTTPIQDLPEVLGDHDCPICFEPDAIRDREAVCPNGHKLCADCQPRVQSVWVFRTTHAACPLCRAPIPYIRDPALPDYVGPQPGPYVPRVRAVQQRDADGRRGDPERPQRAIDAFNNIPARRAAQQVFRENRNNGIIPQNARFGGFHRRNCTCGRKGGAEGVRFLKLPDGTRRYRCEVCYGLATNGAVAPEPPAWNTPAVAMHDDHTV